MILQKVLRASFIVLAVAGLWRSPAQGAPFKALVFSKTVEFRHTSITNGILAIQQLGSANNFTVDATEDGAAFTDANLAQYKVVIFLCTTGDVLDTNQQSAFQRYIEAGGGYAGIHSASDTERAWLWYGQLVGVWESNHPPGTASATVKVTDRFHPSTVSLPERWVRTDEWYNFQTNPAGSVHVLAWVDETTASNYFASATGAMGYDHPIAWCHEFDGGRSWYTALGHTDTSYSEPLFREHLLGGILWAAGVSPGDAGATIWSSFQRTILDNNGLVEPVALDVAPDGRVFYIERVGRLNVFKPDTFLRVQTSISVNSATSCGLIGVALDPGFASNNWIYLVYTPAGMETNRLSRFMVTNNTIDFASEKILLTYEVESSIANHMAGDLEFGPNGDLYLSVGDNSRFSGSPNNGYAPIDERPGQSQGDAQRTAANTMSFRGKILRIHPLPNGTYSIPAGNLFGPGTPLTRPEIFCMGDRNPYRIAVDPGTGWLYWGEVGPDANSDSATQGPRGYDEFNQARQAGFFGWPYGVGNNKPYVRYDFATGVTNGLFDLTNVVNRSPNNTGMTNLPAAQPAWIWYPYGSSTEFPEVGVSGSRCAMAGSFYRYNSNLLSATKLPAYYDNTLFVMDFSRNWLREIKLDASGNILKINKFLPNYTLASPIDMKTGPDGSLYMIEYGNGWRSANVGGQLVHINYTAGNHPPTAVATGTPTDGQPPLQVQFSSAGSVDPEGQLVSYEWDFDLDGVVDSTNANPSFTYTNAGDYVARLTVRDNLGATGLSDVFISVGNTRPVVTIQTPPNGAFFDWDNYIRYSVKVSDAEDGSTDNGTIDCSSLVLETALGHESHAHSEDAFTGCQGAFHTASDHAGTENIYWLFSASYTDRGAPGVEPLLGGVTYRLNPRRWEAEHYIAAIGVATQDTVDPAGGVSELAGITDGDYAMFTPVNLTNITNVILRAAAANGAGGSIEFRLDATNGPLLATATVPVTSGVYSNVNLAVTDPGGTHDLYLVFKGSAGLTNLLALNWIEFSGPGVGIPLQPYTGTPVTLPGTIQAENFDIGGSEIAYHDTSAGNSGGQYRLNTDVDIETCNDTGGGYDIVNVRSNEWLQYTVNPVAAGTYVLQARVSSTAAGGSFRIELDEEDVTGPVAIPDTGGAWQTISISNVVIFSGTQVLRLPMLSDSAAGTVGKFNYLSAVLAASNSAPAVTLVVPASGSVFAAPAMVQFGASATDVDGSIAKVEFYAGSNLLGQAVVPPFALTWSNVPAGTYSLTAKAYDNFNATQISAAAVITVTNRSWSDQDIGTVGSGGAGSFSYNPTQDVYTISDSGSDIWNAADAFHFVYQQTTNNTEIIARVLSIQNTDPWAKAGVMFRASLAAGSANVFMGMSYANGAILSYRTNTSGSCNSIKQAGLGVPYWVRLVRIGNVYNGYYGADGVNWTFLGSVTNVMATPLYVGLGVTSHNTTALNTSTLSSVAINSTPQILNAPTNRRVNIGGSTIFAVTANGAQLLSWQWRFNGANLAGAGQPFYQINPVQAGNAGNYDVVITNFLGSITTAVAQLSINFGPSVSVISPNPGTVFWRPTNVVVTASPNDTDGVARVDFYADNAWFGFKTNVPYLATWSNSPSGAHLLSVLATDSLGATGASPTVLISLTNLPPQLSLPPGNPWMSGALSLNIDGVAGDSSYLEAGTDLVHWTRIATNVLNNSGHYNFIDTNAAVWRSRALYP